MFVDKPQFYDVVSITAFYTVRYNSLTTHQSQPTYTINELQKKKEQETKEDKQKKEKRKKNNTKERKKHKHTHHTRQITRCTIIIIIRIITIPPSTTNIQIHHFK